MNEEQKKPIQWSPFFCWALIIAGAALAGQSARRGLIESLSIGVLMITGGLNLLGKSRLGKKGGGESPTAQHGGLKKGVLLLAIVCLVLGLVTTLPHMTAACLFLLSVLNVIAVAESYTALKKQDTEKSE